MATLIKLATIIFLIYQICINMNQTASLGSVGFGMARHIKRAAALDRSTGKVEEIVEHVPKLIIDDQEPVFNKWNPFSPGLKHGGYMESDILWNGNTSIFGAKSDSVSKIIGSRVVGDDEFLEQTLVLHRSADNPFGLWGKK